MPDTSITLTKEVYDWLKYVIVAALGLLGFNLKRAREQIDDIKDKQSQFVTRYEVNDRIERLETKIDHRLDRIESKIDNINK